MWSLSIINVVNNYNYPHLILEKKKTINQRL